jgi:hypothetical protein
MHATPCGLRHQRYATRIVLCHARDHLDLFGKRLRRPLRRRRSEQREHDAGQQPYDRDDRNNQKQSELDPQCIHVPAS